jgi:hypothetical protein
MGDPVKNTRKVERELTAVLHRRAEDAMRRTNTLAEMQKFQSGVVVDQPRNRPRGRWVVSGVAAAAVAVVTLGVAFVSSNPGQDPSRPPIAQAPGSTGTADIAAAEGFAAAFADHDAAAATTYLAPGEEPWLGWEAAWKRDAAWRVEYLLKPCTKAYDISDATSVFTCPYAMHLLGSRKVGEGPFRGNVLEVTVTDGKVEWAESKIPFETNGVGQQFDSVHAWVAENHPKNQPFLFKDEQDVRPGEWARWTQLWKQYTQEYVAATNGAG